MNYLRNVQFFFFPFWIPFFFPFFFFYMHRDNKVWSARYTTLALNFIYIYISFCSHLIRPFLRYLPFFLPSFSNILFAYILFFFLPL